MQVLQSKRFRVFDSDPVRTLPIAWGIAADVVNVSVVTLEGEFV